MPTSLTDQMFGTEENSLTDRMFSKNNSGSLTDQMFGSAVTNAPTTNAPIEKPKVGFNPRNIRNDFYKNMYGVGRSQAEVDKIKNKVGDIAGETLKGLSTLVTHPYETLKGALDIVLSAPGFALGLIDAGASTGKELLDQVVLREELNLEDAYNVASNSMQRSMEFFEPAKEMIIGKPTEESQLASQVVMAPMTALSMAGHKVADWEGFKEHPNIRGAARFAGDIGGLIVMGGILHGKSGRAEFTKDIESVVNKGNELIAKEKQIESIPNELVKQVQRKALEIEKTQLDLEAKRIADRIKKDVSIKEELGRQAEDLAKEKIRPIQDSGLKKPDIIKDNKDRLIDKQTITENIVKQFPEDGLKYDGEFDRSAIGKDPLYQFTPQEGEFKGRSISVEELSVDAVREKLDSLDKNKSTVFRVVPKDGKFKSHEGDGNWYFPEAYLAIDFADPLFDMYDLYKVEVNINNIDRYRLPNLPKDSKARNIGPKNEYNELYIPDNLIKNKKIVKPSRELYDSVYNTYNEADTIIDVKNRKVNDIDLSNEPKDIIKQGEDSTFFQDRIETNKFSEIYKDREKAVQESVEVFTQKLINDVNKWYHGIDDISIEQVREGLSNLATRADELRGEFITGMDHQTWKDTVSEAAVWASRLDKDRLDIKQSKKKLSNEERIDLIRQAVKNVESRGIKLTSGVDPIEGIKVIVKGAKEVSKLVDDAVGYKRFKPKEATKLLKESFVRRFIDRSGNIRSKLLKSFGDKGYEVIQKMYLSKGASSLSARKLRQMQKEVYRGLNKRERLILDKVILFDRISDIARYKTPAQFRALRKYDPVKIKYYNELFGNIEKLSTDKVQDIRARAKNYYEWMKRPLKDMRDSGLITEAEFESLSNHNYRRLKLIDNYDKSRPGHKNVKRSVYDSGVQSLNPGHESDIFEPSSEIMALEVFNRAYGRILNNEANKALLDVARADKNNGLVKIKEKGDITPSGWHKIYVYENGKRETVYISPEMGKEWITSSPEMTYEMSKVIRYASGSPVLRTFATGINWGFAMANLPRDVMHTWFAARMYKDGKWDSVYSPILPKFQIQMTADLSRTFSDALLRKGRYEDYINEGGGMELLTHQGSIIKRGRHLEGPIDKINNFMGYFGETTEMMTRLAIRDRVIRNRAKERGISYEEAYKNKEIRNEATFVARDYMDFGQGGGIAKGLDNGIPYLNASIQGTRGMFRSFKPGEGTAMSSTFKLAQFATLVTGIYLTAKSISPQTMEDMKGNIDSENSLIIPLGDSFGFEDSKGQIRYPYIKIPLDPGQRFFKTFFEASADKWVGNEVDVDRVVNSLKSQSPVGVTSLPPTVSGTLGYLTNKDFWRNEDIWTRNGKPFSYPQSKEEYIPGRVPQVYIDFGKVTGMSPKRTKYMVEELLTNGTVWSYLLGKGYDELFSDLPKDNREKHLAEVLSKTPITKRFIGITNPYSKFAKVIDKAEEDTVLSRFIENRKLDTLADGYLYKDNVSRKKVFDYIRGAKDYDTYKRLLERFEVQEATKDLHNRSFWLRLQNISVEARARVFVDRLNKADESKKDELWKEFETVSTVKGFISSKFLDEVDKIKYEK